jgi:hypothetical protein
MKNRFFCIAAVFVLLIAADVFASDDMNGYWKLQINITTPNPPAPCAYEDSALLIQQTGTFITGTANLVKIGVGGCPPTLIGTMAGNVPFDPTLGGPFAFFWVDPTYGPFNIAGSFTDRKNASGTFSSPVGAAGISGTWTLTAANAHGAPTLTLWGRILLITLAVLGGAYYLRRRRTAVS